MKSKNKILTGALLVSAFSSLAVVAGSGLTSGSLTTAGDCDHKGYHYAETKATAVSEGNAEFYACCSCHTSWLATEGNKGGSFTDRAFSEAEGGADKYKYYYVVLDAKGGTGGTGTIDSAITGSNLPSITIPTLNNHSFEGYYTEADGGVKYIDATGAGVKQWDLGNNVTLYAHWSENHTYVKVEKVAATVTSDGMDEHYKCTDEGCGKLFKLVDGNYVETTADDLKLSKLASEWNGDIDFNAYCTNGDTSERVSASVENSKLRFTMTGTNHYGEYRSALYYNIKKSDTKKYYMSIGGVSYSSGCKAVDDAASNGYWVKLVIVVVNNGKRTVVGDYYWPDGNYKKMDLSNYVMANEDNNVQIIIQCVYGKDGENKNGEYIDIEKITMTAEDTAPASKTFAAGTYDATAMLLGANTNNLTATTNGNSFTMTVGSSMTWGVVTPVTVWTVSSIEKAYMNVTVSELTSGSWMIFQLATIDGASGEKYLNTDQNATGTYKIPLASNGCSGMTGSHTFQFRFGVAGTTNGGFSATISSIELILE